MGSDGDDPIFFLAHVPDGLAFDVIGTISFLRIVD